MLKQEQKAIAKVKKMPTETICAAYEQMAGNHEKGAAQAREWFMNELEARWPESFEKWMDSDIDQPSKFFN